ncbi:MAG: DNA primase [Bacteroidetes bacterium]|nr:DNA primase [Bacteroidota bacterium]
MIPKETVDKIIDAARVEEVVGEFVTLKKRGANYLGLCPFHGEKTPSFTVSAVKGIYKCFGCSKAGNSVNFIMDHLQLSYPEALRWLAKKYSVEIVEREITPEEKERNTERDSLMIVMQYAQRYFTDKMLNGDEGRSIGLGYFQERGLRDDIIQKFQLGYSLEARRAFSEDAVKAGYQAKYLVKTGMSILSNNHAEGTEITVKDIFDRYAGRVMFPIQDDGGRVVAFGGRTLSSDKKIAKYINSPETDIYNKSKILYGLWLGKKSVQKEDCCYLVEGYMDVIAMHQAGVENVVASSGTSLTVDQIKSIHRFTNNIIVLYDGDEAGQKASNRAIPLLLEEGMNVKLLMFPDNDDPDSFSRKVTIEEFQSYIKENAQDFLMYKAKKITAETKNDPIKRAGVIKDIVESISLIPDNIIRSIYIKDCANVMEIEESILQMEVNKIRRKIASKGKPGSTPESYTEPNITTSEILEDLTVDTKEKEPLNFDAEEKELLRIMLTHGNILITIDAEDENQEKHDLEITLAEFILFELWRDEITFENPIHQTVLDEYIKELSEQRLPNLQHFSMSQDPIISSFVINHVMNNYELSGKWAHFGVHVSNELSNIKKTSQHLLFSLKEKKLHHYISLKQELLKDCTPEETQGILQEILHLTTLKSRVNKLLGRIVVK